MKLKYDPAFVQRYLIKINDFRAKHPLTIYMFPVLAILIVSYINFVFPVFNNELTLQYAALIILIAWYSGLLVGIAATVVLVVGANHFFPQFFNSYDIFFALIFFPTAIIIGSLVVGQRQALIAVNKLALYDALTGLANRRLLYEKLELIINMAFRGNGKLGIIFLDIDNFKKLNDEFGHEVGDSVLKHVASLLQDNARAEDIVSRYGGDEFIVVLSRIKNADEAVQVAQRIVADFSVDFHHQEITAQLTVSVGVAIYPEHGLETSQLIRRADSALYQAKASGRNLYILA